MHWRTYERIAAEIRARDHDALAAVSAETDSLIAQIERRYGPLGACDRSGNLRKPKIGTGSGTG
jgi:hypothetical protein